VLTEEKIMGFGRKIFKLHHPNQFGVNYAKLEVHQVEFQKILELVNKSGLAKLWKIGLKDDIISPK
jgi:hypothetical protein